MGGMRRASIATPAADSAAPYLERYEPFVLRASSRSPLPITAKTIQLMLVDSPALEAEVDVSFVSDALAALPAEFQGDLVGRQHVSMALRRFLDMCDPTRVCYYRP